MSGWTNSGIKLSLFALVLLSPSQAFARSWSPEEYNFVVGYQAFLERNVVTCAETFGRALNLPEPLHSRARLYLASCQTRLGSRKIAAYHLDRVDPAWLSQSDRQILTDLASSLSVEREYLHSAHTYLLTYGGAMAYIPTTTKSSANFLGLYGETSYQGWKLMYGLERLAIVQTESVSSYVQAQVQGGLSKNTSDTTELHGKVVFISGNQDGYRATFVPNLGLSDWLGSKTRLGMDLYYLVNPNSVLGNLSVLQAYITLDQWITSNPKFSVWFRLGSHTLLPSAQTSTDSSTGFSLKSVYQRAVGELNLAFYGLQIGGTLWAGSEAFGVRRDGGVIFTSPQEHNFGWSLLSRVQLQENWGVHATFSREEMTVGSNKSALHVLWGAIFFNL